MHVVLNVPPQASASAAARPRPRRSLPLLPPRCAPHTGPASVGLRRAVTVFAELTERCAALYHIACLLKQLAHRHAPWQSAPLRSLCNKFPCTQHQVRLWLQHAVFRGRDSAERRPRRPAAPVALRLRRAAVGLRHVATLCSAAASARCQSLLAAPMGHPAPPPAQAFARTAWLPAPCCMLSHPALERYDVYMLITLL